MFTPHCDARRASLVATCSARVATCCAQASAERDAHSATVDRLRREIDERYSWVTLGHSSSLQGYSVGTAWVPCKLRHEIDERMARMRHRVLRTYCPLPAACRTVLDAMTRGPTLRIYARTQKRSRRAVMPWREQPPHSARAAHTAWAVGSTRTTGYAGSTRASACHVRDGCNALQSAWRAVQAHDGAHAASCRLYDRLQRSTTSCNTSNSLQLAGPARITRSSASCSRYRTSATRPCSSSTARRFSFSAPNSSCFSSCCRAAENAAYKYNAATYHSQRAATALSTGEGQRERSRKSELGSKSEGEKGGREGREGRGGRGGEGGRGGRGGEGGRGTVELEPGRVALVL